MRKKSFTEVGTHYKNILCCHYKNTELHFYNIHMQTYNTLLDYFNKYSGDTINIQNNKTNEYLLK